VLRHKPLYLACLLLQVGFIFLSGLRDTIGFIGRDYTWAPSFLRLPAQKAETVLSSVLGDDLEPLQPVRQGLNIYTRAAGIENGYAFFAPNVPDANKLVFELHYPDGRLEYDLPHVSSESAGLRFATLLDHLAETRSDELREVMIKMIAFTIWRAHPGASMVRAVFGIERVPTAEQFRHGTKDAARFLYAYDFVFAPSAEPSF
jgi:hypothetical protein